MSTPKKDAASKKGEEAGAKKSKRTNYSGYADGPWKIIRRLAIVLLVAVIAGGTYLAFRYKKSARESQDYLQESEAALQAGDREESLRLANQAVRAAETPENGLQRCSKLLT